MSSHFEPWVQERTIYGSSMLTCIIKLTSWNCCIEYTGFVNWQKLIQHLFSSQMLYFGCFALFKNHWLCSESMASEHNSEHLPVFSWGLVDCLLAASRPNLKRRQSSAQNPACLSSLCRGMCKWRYPTSFYCSGDWVNGANDRVTLWFH